MPGFMPDSDCMIASVSGWHNHHARAADAIRAWRGRQEPLILAAPALIESYAVLTRLPPQHRMSPRDALAVLKGSFIDAGEIVALEPADYVAFLGAAPGDGVLGGRTYDGVIAACALKAQVNALLTFNVAHFQGFARRGLEIVVP